MRPTLDELVDRAQRGDKDALEQVVREIQDRVHRLAIRFLAVSDDALSATQEILILVVTKLSTFRGESSFQTWVYRVAVNYLLSAKRAQRPSLTFEAFGQDLASGLVAQTGPEDRVMLNELRVSCTMAMLVALEPAARVAYVLGDILELEHQEAATALGIAPAAFRKRLSRARGAVVEFTTKHCGVVNPNAACHCPRRLPAAIQAKRVRPGRVVYARDDGPSYDEALRSARAVEGSLVTLKAQQATSTFPCPEDLAARISELVAVRSENAATLD